jgi:octaprenyl-diphosphate synthase
MPSTPRASARDYAQRAIDAIAGFPAAKSAMGEAAEFAVARRC